MYELYTPARRLQMDADLVMVSGRQILFYWLTCDLLGSVSAANIAEA